MQSKSSFVIFWVLRSLNLPNISGGSYQSKISYKICFFCFDFATKMIISDDMSSPWWIFWDSNKIQQPCTKLWPNSPLIQKRKCLYWNSKNKWQLRCPSLNRRATARQGVLRSILRRKRCGAAVLFSRYIHKHHGYKLTTTSAERWQRHIGVPGWMLSRGGNERELHTIVYSMISQVARRWKRFGFPMLEQQKLRKLCQ